MNRFVMSSSRFAVLIAFVAFAMVAGVARAIVNTAHAGPVTLSWSHRLKWDMFGGLPRTLDVQVRDEAGVAILESVFFFSTDGTSGDTGWVANTADLSSHAGTTVTLTFVESIPEPFTGPGQAYVDAISLLDDGVELLTNGGFESGDFTGWVASTASTGGSGDPLAPWSVSSAEGTLAATNGFDGGGPMEYTLTQTIAIPAATTGGTVTAGSVASQPGGEAVVTIDISDASGITAIDLVVQYDATNLTLLSDANGVTLGTSTAGWSLDYLETAPGTIDIGLFTSQGGVGIGVGDNVVDLHFDVGVGIPFDTASSIGVNSVDFSQALANDVPAVTAPGGVDIIGVVHGDVSNNDDLGAFDASFVLEASISDIDGIAPLDGVTFPISDVVPVWGSAVGEDLLTVSPIFGAVMEDGVPLNAYSTFMAADSNENGLLEAMDASDILLVAVQKFPSISAINASNLLPAAPGMVAGSVADLLRVTAMAERPADTLTVSLDTSALRDLYAGELNLEFPSELLRPARVFFEDDARSDSSPLLAQRTVGNELRVAFASASPISSSRLNVEFEVIHNLRGPASGLVRASHMRLNRTKVDIEFGHALRLEPYRFQLMANYPNPFNPETWIPFELAEDSDVTIRIYSLNGVRVRTLTLGNMPVGVHRDTGSAAYWDGRNEHGEHVASGAYVYELIAGDYHATRRMVVLK